jgi:N utilization substance protein B
MRETAFQLIFEMAFHSGPISQQIDDAILCRELNADEYVIHIVSLTHKNLSEIDEQISLSLKNWRIERIPRVTLALLRLAVCEFMYFPEVPIGASINEAIELAKKYASEEDGAFINGVLGTLARTNAYKKSDEKNKEVADVSNTGN